MQNSIQKFSYNANWATMQKEHNMAKISLKSHLKFLDFFDFTVIVFWFYFTVTFESIKWYFVLTYCDLKMLQILSLQPRTSKGFSGLREHFFLTVGQNNFGSKIPRKRLYFRVKTTWVEVCTIWTICALFGWPRKPQ